MRDEIRMNIDQFKNEDTKQNVFLVVFESFGVFVVKRRPSVP